MSKLTAPDRSPAECVELLGWTVRHFAREVGADDRTVRRWLDGTAQVPEPLAAWLRTLATLHQAMPAPAWRVRERQGDAA